MSLLPVENIFTSDATRCNTDDSHLYRYTAGDSQTIRLLRFLLRLPIFLVSA